MNDRATLFWFISYETNLIVSWINNRVGIQYVTVIHSSKLHFLSVQYSFNNGEKRLGVYDLRCGNMNLDVEVGGIGLIFCLQNGGAEQQAEHGNELFHFTLPQGLKPKQILQFAARLKSCPFKATTISIDRVLWLSSLPNAARPRRRGIRCWSERRQAIGRSSRGKRRSGRIFRARRRARRPRPA
jgi:hypothetical protein